MRRNNAGPGPRTHFFALLFVLYRLQQYPRVSLRAINKNLLSIFLSHLSTLPRSLAWLRELRSRSHGRGKGGAFLRYCPSGSSFDLLPRRRCSLVGTWCHQSKRNLPELSKQLSENPTTGARGSRGILRWVPSTIYVWLRGTWHLFGCLVRFLYPR